MSIKTLQGKLKKAQLQDPSIFCDKLNPDETFGSNPDYLLDVFGITKNDLIRLERKGLALKARYETRHPKQDLFDKLNRARQEQRLDPLRCKNGTHRVRWLIFKEALNAT